MSSLTTYHNLVDLFNQLGLPSSSEEINNFFDKHSPLPAHIDLWDAPWWNKSQSDFLHTELKADAN
jgi:hypothetical protein